MNKFRLLAMMFCAAALSSCATPAAPPPPPEVAPVVVTPAEQDAAAFALFEDLYKFTENRTRAESVPKIIETYETIIRRYPQAALAQEAYMKLVLINLEEVDPPDEARAEAYYRELMDKYPESVMKASVEGAFLKHYYQRKEWDKLLGLTAGLVRGRLENPHRGHLFYYAEANYHLGRREEAIRGYRLLIEKAPQSSEARFASKRLQEIRDATATEPGSR